MTPNTRHNLNLALIITLVILGIAITVGFFIGLKYIADLAMDMFSWR